MPIFTNKDTQAGKPKSINVGQIVGATITGTMTGYVNGASLTISAPPAGGVQAVGTILVTGGVITGIALTERGAGYTVAATMTAPTGTGATLTPTVKLQDIRGPLNSDIVFVSQEEAALVGNRLKGIKAPGWYRITEKTQNDGTQRYFTENLIAMTVTDAVAGDNIDDGVVADIEIAITAQPASVAVTAPAAASFTVAATGTALTYQWQLQAGGVGAYADIANSGVYTTSTTATLNISNSTGLNGNRYRVVVNGTTSKATSSGAKLTVN
jgi:hypothetical protein